MTLKSLRSAGPSDSVPHVASLLSPYRVVNAIADALEEGEPIVGRIWLVRKTPADSWDEAGAVSNRRIGPSAWPRWFRETRQAFRKPLLYLLRSESVAGLAAAMLETGGRGVFCNDAEAFRSRWRKGGQPP